ncbi:translation initiation factor eIF-2B [Populus alba x Populus x berolinensis]|uniref:Translation initiation factor eIF2B subunit delta n=1 Tax=Populus alba x Populus x berolinensis TaxID=444605 RepID=A0AAD6PUQ4_9ROSI|nr:translation initiation factor eIF-2B [Populus alba x Populus x berolinensis]
MIVLQLQFQRRREVKGPRQRIERRKSPQPRMQYDDKESGAKRHKSRACGKGKQKLGIELSCFRHLCLNMNVKTQLTEHRVPNSLSLDPMHPAVYKVGFTVFVRSRLCGGNARCIAMLQAFQEAIKDYSTPSEKTLARDLTAKIVEVKASLHSDIDRFINEKIILADKVIVKHAVTKISDGDVLLTYGSPSAVEMVLLHAHELGKQFRVVVVDSRPKLEGQLLLHRLVGKGINFLSNGTVYSRVGTACVAMVAHAFRVPVLVCCEAYKFHERVQLDSLCSNELGDPDVISKVRGREYINLLDGSTDSENLQLLNLIYDANLQITFQ